MIKFALAALVALAWFAPSARAADEFKPPRQIEQAAPTCRMPAAEADPKAAPAPRLTKLELEALAKLPLCSSSAPQEMCVMVDQKAYDEAAWTRHRNGAMPPAWVQNYDECMRRQIVDPAGAGGAED
jgi:hypothetical protein